VEGPVAQRPADADEEDRPVLLARLPLALAGGQAGVAPGQVLGVDEEDLPAQEGLVATPRSVTRSWPSSRCPAGAVGLGVRKAPMCPDMPTLQQAHVPPDRRIGTAHWDLRALGRGDRLTGMQDGEIDRQSCVDSML